MKPVKLPRNTKSPPNKGPPKVDWLPRTGGFSPTQLKNMQPSNWIISPGIRVNIKNMLKPPPLQNLKILMSWFHRNGILGLLFSGFSGEACETSTRYETPKTLATPKRTSSELVIVSGTSWLVLGHIYSYIYIYHISTSLLPFHVFLVGGFNPLWKILDKNGNLPQIGGEYKKYLKPPTSFCCFSSNFFPNPSTSLFDFSTSPA